MMISIRSLLPVLIHTVAKRLKSTDEPLAKFARSFASDPKLRGLDSYVEVVQELKVLAAYEALNLMYILSFFSQHIPVEMISLGLAALDPFHVRVKTRDPTSGRTLNSTFRTLNMYALIERNEHDIGLQSSSQSLRETREMLADNIDVIRLHGVVQGFFADYLHTDKDPHAFTIWLDRAVRVFCCSYDMAGQRIARKTNTGLVEDYRLYEIHGIKLREHVTKQEKKTPMIETVAMLDIRLALIKEEIDRRTPEFSNIAAGGGAAAFQTSIFDRTSSSSDTNPETPGDSDRAASRVSTWGFDPDQVPHESPVDLFQNTLGLNPVFKSPFPPDIPEDIGYDSDLETTIQPSSQTTKASRSPISPGGVWEKVLPRRKPRSRFELGNHRTTRNKKYSDRAGSFRLENIDPRAASAQVTRETALGHVYNSHSRAPSRGRMSGQSIAEVALASISATSPPPARGGGAIQSRRSGSQQSSDKGRFLAGAVSYASAVSGFASNAVFGEPVRPATEAQIKTNENTPPTIMERRRSSAVRSLQQFPLPAESHLPSPSTSQAPVTPRPPYPSSPGYEDQLRFPGSDTSLYELSGQYSQDNLPLEADVSKTYPRMPGQVPYETADATSAQSKRNSGHSYPGWFSQNDAESLQSSIHSVQHPPFLSFSSPDIRPSEDTYYPGRPEYSSHNQIQPYEAGYTSQPMSRDPSGQSGPSDQYRLSPSSAYPGEWIRRRPSLAETEPAPQLPEFSPRIPPTSYEVYERMRDVREERVTVRRGSRLEISKVSERLEEWTVVNDHEDISPSIPRSRTPFNPAAPSFSPQPSAFTYSPTLPPPPPNSMFSNPSTATSQYPSPLPHQPRKSSPLSPTSPYAPPPPSTLTPYPPQLAERRPRSGSGGLRIGHRVIEFGDIPEPVDVERARERAERGRAGRALGLGISDVRRLSN